MPTTQTATFLFCDLVASTELFARLGPDRAETVRRDVYAALRQASASHAGHEVKATGDGLFVVFGSGTDALDGAVAMQQAISRVARRDPSTQLALRVGIAVGDAAEEDGDWHGVPVVEAARLCAAAEAGEILVSEPVHTLFGSRRSHEFESRRALTLKGLGARAAVPLRWEPVDDRPPLPRALQPLARSFFVGRENELDTIARSFKEVAGADGPRLVLLGGEPGVGKTRLAAEAAARAHDEGALVLFGRCDEGVGMPYQPFVEALHPYLESLDPSALSPRLAKAVGEVGRVMPAAVLRFENVASPTKSDPETERYLLFDAIAQLLACAAADGPAVVVLDDVQWATQPTLLLVRHLVQSHLLASVLVLATYRDTELDRTHPLSDLLADLHRVSGVARLAVRGLDAESASEFVAMMAGHALDEQAAELTTVLVHATLGNPLFLREVLIHLAESGSLVRDDEGHWRAAPGLTPATIGVPLGIREVVARRVGRLSDEANQALSVASIVGPTFDVELLDAVIDALDADQLLDALDEATRAGLLIESAAGYEFAHALIRQSLYDDITSPRRIRLHRRVGEALEVRDDLDRHLEVLVHHFGECASDTDLTRAADYALLAAERALDQVASEAALQLAERALTLLHRLAAVDDERCAYACAVLSEAYGMDRFEDAKAAAMRGVEHARRAGSPQPLARCAALYAAMNPTGQADPIVEGLLDEALAAVGPRDHEHRALVLAHRSLYRAIAAGDNPGASRVADEAVRAARAGSDLEILRWALVAKLQSLCGTPDVAAQLELIHELEQLRDAVRASRVFLGLETPAFKARACLELGDLDGFDRALVDEELLVGKIPRSNANNLRAVRALIDGRLDDAQRHADETLATKPDADTLSVYAGLVFFIARASGRSADIVPMLHETILANPGIVAFRSALTVALCDTGALDQARPHFDSLMHDLPDLPRDYTWPGTLFLLAEACARLGDVEAAPTLYQELLPHSGHVVVVAHVVSGGDAVDRYLGMLAAVQGHRDRAESHYRAALELETRLPAPLAVSRTQEWLDRLDGDDN